jgi:hypothetical protein
LYNNVDKTVFNAIHSHLQPLLDSRDLDIEVDSNADDSDDENEDEDDDIDDDPFSNVLPKDENVEHSNPHSFAWCLTRHACIVLAQQNLEKFLSMAGIEYSGKKDNFILLV